MPVVTTTYEVPLQIKILKKKVQTGTGGEYEGKNKTRVVYPFDC